MRRGKERGNNGIGDLILDDVGRLARPWRVDDDFNVRDVRQRIEWDAGHRPDARGHDQQRRREDEEEIARAPLNDSRDHLHAPRCAHGELLAGNGLTVLLGEDGDLPGSSA
jgi:rhodanese-related sulfurtransferase